MSVSAAAIADPFDVTALDETTELTALANALRLADGFRLIFVRCNQPSQRLRLMAKLGLLLSQDTFDSIFFTEPIPHLLDAIRDRLPEALPRALFVSGLEYSLPVADEAENTSFIANLNASRNSFPAAIPFPLVLWLPEYALTAIVRGAPDFFSIRSGVYFFAASPAETAPLVNAVIAGDSWLLENFLLLEKQERVEAIEVLLQDYQALSHGQRDYRAESLLLDRLGILYSTLGHWKMSELAFQQSLQICRELGDRHGEGATLGNLGTVYRCQNCLAEAEQAHQQSLQIYRELGDRHGEGTALTNLGNVYQLGGQWVEAEQVYQQGLLLFHEIGDRHGEGATLNNLGTVYRQQGRWIEAEQAYQQDLQLCRELSDLYGQGQTLGNLGNVYQLQGRWVEAELFYKHSLQLYRKLGNHHNEGGMLGNLALVKAAEGNIMEALRIGRSAVEILRTTEDAALLRKTQEWVEEWERQAQDVSHT